MPVTPMQMRERSWQFLASARSDILGGRADSAEHNVGLAAELALKARYCTKMGWPTWPANRGEYRRLVGNTSGFDHDLAGLLRLSDSTHIPTYASIDWGSLQSALAWDIEDRYAPSGTADPAVIEQRVRDTQALCDQLQVFELIRNLQKLHLEFAERHGWFNLFSLQARCIYKYTLILASEALEVEAVKVEVLARCRSFRAALDEDLQFLWKRTEQLPVGSREVLFLNGFTVVRGPATVSGMFGCVSDSGPVYDQYIMASGDARVPPEAGQMV